LGAVGSSTSPARILRQSVRPPTDDSKLLSFDDLLPGLILNGYGGLEWNNFGVLDGSILPVTSGLSEE
jgi:hypothetical protein